MLALLRNAWPQFQPSQISVDFELGLVNAFEEHFLPAEVNGCFFHLVKSMKSKLPNIGLLRRYHNEPSFALSARMIPSLAFVPPPAIDAAIDVLAPDLPADLMPLLNYFEDHYVGRLRHAFDGQIARAPSRFPIEMWSVHQRTLGGEDRTNNFAEAAHRRLQGEFGVDHPSKWKFIDGLREAKHGRDRDYARSEGGFEPEKKRLKYIKADERILSIVGDFNTREILSYLSGLAKNFKMEARSTDTNTEDED